MIEEAVYSRLNTYSGVSALVSGRIYPDILPQNPTYPAITYVRISAVHTESLDGSAGLASPRFEFNCWHTNPTTARTVREKVRLALQGFSGISASMLIYGVSLVDERDFYESDVQVYRKSVDYMIWHGEPIPD